MSPAREERVSVELLELTLMASGMARSHRGFAGTCSFLYPPAAWPPGDGANGVPLGRPARPSSRPRTRAPAPSGSRAGSLTAAPVPDRTEARVPSRAPGAASTLASRLRRRSCAASSSTRPPDPGTRPP